jgi:hypothetical protein
MYFIQYIAFAHIKKTTRAESLTLYGEKLPGKVQNIQAVWRQ